MLEPIDLVAVFQILLGTCARGGLIKTGSICFLASKIFPVGQRSESNFAEYLGMFTSNFINFETKV